jgi:tetratricopeptide (TPR) repeat protein
MSKLLNILFHRVLFFTFTIFLSGIFSLTSAAGLPEEFLVTQRWRTLFSTNSPLTNPSFINEENYLCVRGVYTSILGEFITIEDGAVYPIGLYQSAGFSWIRQGLRKSYQKTDRSGNPVDGVMVSDNSDYFMATYAYNPWGGLTVGINANILLKQFDEVSSLGGGTDIGISYRAIQNPLIGTHTLGLNLQNLLFLPLTNTDFANTLPRVLRVSLNSNYLEHQVESSFDFSLRDLGTSSEDFITNSAETEWNFDAKVGGWILKIFKVYGLLGLTEESLSYYGLAGGVNIPTINNGRDLSFLIQYLNLPNVEDQSPSSFLSMYIRADIGKHREEIYARKMARLAQFQPNELYIQGLKLYSEGKYWDAFFIFSRLFVEFPDFFKSDWVSFFLGSCQEKLDMRLTAEEAFKKTKELYSRS